MGDAVRSNLPVWEYRIAETFRPHLNHIFRSGLFLSINILVAARLVRKDSKSPLSGIERLA